MISTLSVLGPIFSTWNHSKMEQEFYGPKSDVQFFFSDCRCPRPYRKKTQNFKNILHCLSGLLCEQIKKTRGYALIYVILWRFPVTTVAVGTQQKILFVLLSAL